VSLFPVVFEDGSGGDLFGPVAIAVVFLCLLDDVLVLTLLFVANALEVLLAGHVASDAVYSAQRMLA
jgi:hypothetical protein